MRYEITTGKEDLYPVYFIGAGPGHVKYLTMEGNDALQKCGLVYAMEPYPETFSALLQGKTIIDPFDRVFDELVREVEEHLRTEAVGFLVPGDITIFSPFLPIVEHFGDCSVVIAGVGALNAAAAACKKTLNMPGVSHSVALTSPKYISKEGDVQELDRLARASGTLVLYMNNRPLDQLADELSGGFEPDTPVVIASRIGMENEKIYRCTLITMAEAVGDDDIFGLVSGEPSLAIIIVGDVLTAKSDPEFWNERKEKFWNRKRGHGDTETRGK